MERFCRRGRLPRPAVLALGLAALAGARAEAARLRQEVARLDLKVETLAEAHTATQARAVRPWAAGAAGAGAGAAGDFHELAVAAGVAGKVLDRDVHALASIGLATGTMRALVRVDAVRPSGYTEATRPGPGQGWVLTGRGPRPHSLGLAVGPRQGNSTVWFQQLGPGLYWDSGSPHCRQARPSGKLFWPVLPELDWVRAPCTARPLELMEIPDPLPPGQR
jgi:hypothetical protein